MTPPAAPSRSSRPVDCSDATHSSRRCRSGTAASAAPAPPTTTQATSCLRSGASAGAAILVSFSATPLVARVPRIPRPIATPRARADRGINDGPKASSTATVSRGAAGDTATGLSALANRRARAFHSPPPSTAVARSMPSVPSPSNQDPSRHIAHRARKNPAQRATGATQVEPSPLPPFSHWARSRRPRSPSNSYRLTSRSTDWPRPPG